MIRETLHTQIVELIDRLADGSQDAEARDALIDDVLTWQREHVSVLGRWSDAMGDAALPTDAFRYGRVASFEQSEQVGVFQTSGTTTNGYGLHPHRDLRLYDHAAQTAAKFGLFPDCEKMDLLIVAPTPNDAPNSSLFYMLGRFAEWFGADVQWFVKGDELDVTDLNTRLFAAAKADRPVALLGTSLAFLQLEEALDTTYRLAPGSRIMHTGGFKGRSITVEPDALRALLSTRYGVLPPFVVREYGMTEMSSQLYEWCLRDVLAERKPRHRYWIPGWVRVSAVQPAALLGARAQDERSILRIDDLANLDTCTALQTMDQGELSEDGLVLKERLRTAVPRGCSLTAEEWTMRS